MKPSTGFRSNKEGFLFAGLLLAACLLFAFSLKAGSVAVRFSDVQGALSGRLTDETLREIILRIRFPRAVAAFVLGGALALSGYLLQTFFKNPVAGPFILGLSSGAKLFVALCLIVFTGSMTRVSSFVMILASFAGATLTMLIVLYLSGKVRQVSMLIVCGIMIGYICSAVTDFLVTFADEQQIVNLHNWSRGSFSGSSWSGVAVMVPVTLITAVFVFCLSKPLNAYRFSEDFAKSVGVNVRSLRVRMVLLSGLLSGISVAFAGPVSFVGVAVPHLVKAMFRTERPIILIPASYLGGGVFCLFSDLIARNLFSPTELNISTVTAIFGAPVVIRVLIRRRKGEAA